MKLAGPTVRGSCFDEPENCDDSRGIDVPSKALIDEVSARIDELLTKLVDPEPAARVAAAHTIGWLGSELPFELRHLAGRTIDPLIKALTDSDVRFTAVKSLVRLVVDCRLETDLITIFHDHFLRELDAQMRAMLVHGLAGLGGLPIALPGLLDRLRTDAPEVRESIASGFADCYMLGHEQEIEAPLRACLDDACIGVRIEAAAALHYHGLAKDTDLVLLVAGGLAAPDKHHRCAAVNRLAKMGKAASPFLGAIIELARDSNYETRAHVVKALENTDCADTIALPVLESLAQDPNAYVQFLVNEALERRGRPQTN